MSGFWKYQKACWDQTVESARWLSPRWNLAIAILPGLALWLLGGVLEWRNAEVAGYWLTIVLCIAALALHFILSPFLIWKKLTAAAEGGADTGPVTYVDLAILAAKNLGWNFADNWEQADFANCIAAGCGVGGKLTMLALLDHNLDRRLRDQQQPLELRREYWPKKKLSIDNPTSTRLDKMDNWDIQLDGNEDGVRKVIYRDPRLSNCSDAVAWLKSQSAKYRGNQKRQHDQEQAAKKQRGEAGV